MFCSIIHLSPWSSFGAHFIYPEKDNAFVEHLHPDEMRGWLRTEPQSLPFSEVWEDIKTILSDKREFRTVAKKNPFSAYISNEPLGIRVVAAKQKYLLPYETLSLLWQQLRTYGFSMRHIAPGIDRQVSYVLSIFNELEYVTPVNVADDYGKYDSASATGLQILPSAFFQRTEYTDAVQQLSLF